MKTSVLIPAHNEAAHLANLLETLPADRLDPLVILNGTDDDSREIIGRFGARFRDYEDKGKLPAIQSTLRSLGKEALAPILMIDADTRPVFPKLWHKVLLKTLVKEDAPTYISGPVLFTPRAEGVLIEHSALTVFRYASGVFSNKNNIKTGNAAFYGPNQGFKLNDLHVLEAVTGLPHYWPKEDVAMAKSIVEEGGIMHQISDLRAVSRSQVSHAMPPMLDWLRKSPGQIDEEIVARYRSNAAEGSIPYLD